VVPVLLAVPAVRVLFALVPADLAAHCFPAVRRVRVLVVQLVHAHPVLRVVPDLMESDPDRLMVPVLRVLLLVPEGRVRLNLRQCNQRCCC
jgi:hypothetical protein